MRLLLLLCLLIPVTANSATLKFKWTNPSINADSFDCHCTAAAESLGKCVRHISACDDLRGMKPWVINYATNDTTLFPEIPTTKIGQPDSSSLTISDNIRYGELILKSIDTSSNMLCYGTHLQFTFPAPLPPPPADTSGTGLSGNYYTWTGWSDFDKFLGTQIDTTINFNWGAGNGYPGGPADYWSVIWTGKVLIPYTGRWTFYVNSAEGIKLWIDDVLCQDYWTARNAETSNSIDLVTGPHTIKLQYFTKWGNANITMSWSEVSTPKAVIPRGNLLPN